MMTLPLAAIISIIVWMMGDLEDLLLWTGCGVTLLTTYIVMELNNYFQLLRIRTRLMSSTYLMLATAMVGLHQFDTEMLVPLSVLGTLFLLFETYQDARPEGKTFYAFAALGLGSMVFAPILILALPLWYAMGAYLRTLSLRTIATSLLGIVCPYWLILAAGTLESSLWTWITVEVPAHFEACFAAQIFDAYYVEPRVFVGSNLDRLVALAFMLILSVRTTLHYQHTDYLDKIRTRMYLHTFRLLQAFFVAFAVLWPDYFGVTIRLLMITTAVFASHYFAVAKGRWANLSFGFWMIALIGLFVFNLF